MREMVSLGVMNVGWVATVTAELGALEGLVSSGQVAEGGGQAASLLSTLEGLPLDVVDRGPLTYLRGELERGENSEEAIRGVHALAGALVASYGPDRFLSDPPAGPFRIIVGGESRPAAPPTQVETEGSFGEAIFQEARAYPRGPLRRLQDALFRWMLQNETLKKQFIAFMDAIAGRDDPHLIAELAREYFPRKTTQSSGLFGLLLKAGTLPIVPDRLLAWGIQKGVGMMADRFLTGETLEQALATVAHLHEQGIYTSLDVVREKVVSQKEADDYRDRVLGLMKLWAERYQGPAYTAGGVPVRHVSLKLSALTHRFDPLATDEVLTEAGARLLEIFKAAKGYADQGKPILINIDLEEDSVNSLSYRLFWETFTHEDLAGWEEAGIVVQAYLKDSEPIVMQNIDLARRTGKRPQLRIVKGAYHKYEQITARRMGWEVPVYLTQRETNDNFRRLVRLALQNRDVLRVTTGSHNLNDLGFSQEERERMRVARAIVEAQALFGVGDPILAATHRQGIPSRSYGPFGRQAEAIGYLVRRLAEVGPESAIGQTHVIGSFDRYNPRGELPLSHPEAPFRLEAEPDFSHGVVRLAMQKAITCRENRDPPIVQPLIGEAEPTRIAAETPEASVNPAHTSDIVALVQNAREEDVKVATRQAQEGHRKWSIMTEKQRAKALYKTAELVKERQYEIAATLVAEAGKPWPSALDEVCEAINFLRSYAADGVREGPFREALGVGVAIAPFNFSFAIAMGEMAAGLAAGNAMILKPAEQTPAAGRLVCELLREGISQSLAGGGIAPPMARTIACQTVQFLPGAGEVIGQRLVESELVDFIIFTGSKPTADIIIKTAAEHPPARGGVKVVVAETGGKNPMIIDETADLDVAVETVLVGAFQYNGQRCSATSRVIVTDSVKEVFIARLISGARSMVIGNPRDPATQLGPQIDKDSFDKVQRYARLGIEAGARLAYAAEAPEPLAARGFFIGPHIFTDVDPSSPLAREEIFGPVLAIITATSFDHALEIANDSNFGLTAGLVSRHPGHIRKFLARMEAGNKYVNRPQIGARPYETPFGGGKDSGTGPKAGGRHLVARLGRPRQHRLSQRDHEGSPTEQPLEGNRVLDDRVIRAAQHAYASRPWRLRIACLANLERRLDHWITGSKVQAGLPETIHLQAIRDRIRLLQQNAPSFLSPTETIGLAGERNELAHDGALGVGLIWTAEESFADLVSAAAAALAMGNAVVLPTTREGVFVRQLLLRAGFPREVLIECALPSSQALEQFDFDFIVAHGEEGPKVHRAAMLRPRTRPGFRRVIGVLEDPTEWRYPTYFAHETTRTERTLRHGADLDLRSVLTA